MTKRQNLMTSTAVAGVIGAFLVPASVAHAATGDTFVEDGVAAGTAVHATIALTANSTGSVIATETGFSSGSTAVGVPLDFVLSTEITAGTGVYAKVTLSSGTFVGGSGIASAFDSAGSVSSASGSCAATTFSSQVYIDCATVATSVGVRQFNVAANITGTTSSTASFTYGPSSTAEGWGSATGAKPALSTGTLVSVTDASSSLTAPTLLETANPVFSTFGNGNTSATIAQFAISLGTQTDVSISAINDANDSDSFSSLTVTLTHPILAYSGVSTTLNPGVAASSTTGTINQSAGTATFAVSRLDGTFDNIINAAGAGATRIAIGLDGTHQFTSQAAGTAAVALAHAGSLTGSTSATVNTTAVNQGGFTAQFNYLMPTGLSFSSYLRIHNPSATSGTVQIQMFDTAGNSLGTYPASGTLTVASNSATQIAISDIETALGVSVSTSNFYVAEVTGTFVGYAQHVVWGSATGALTNLSSRDE